MKIRKFNESINHEIVLSDIDEKIKDMFQEIEDLDLDFTIKTGIYNGDDSKNFTFHNNDLRTLRLNDGVYISYLISIRVVDERGFIDIKDSKLVDIIEILKNKQDFYDEFKFYLSLSTNIKIHVLTNIRIMDKETTYKFKSLATEFSCSCKVLSSTSVKFGDSFMEKVGKYMLPNYDFSAEYKEKFYNDFEVIPDGINTILKIKSK